jgi:hypothetical protein
MSRKQFAEMPVDPKLVTILTALKNETPWDRWMRRQPEVEAAQQAAYDKKQEIDDELDAAQKLCKHVDDGGMFYGGCKKCGKSFD